MIYQNLIKKMHELRCDKCHGLGQVDDAEPGDIDFSIYKCSACDGTGFEHAKEYAIVTVVDAK